MRRFSALAITLALTVGATAACSGGGKGGSSASGSNELYGAAPDTPLSRFFGGDDDASRARFDEQQRRQQEAVAQCMAKQGFRYIPVDPAASGGSTTIGGPSGAAAGMTKQAYVDTYGFGLSAALDGADPTVPTLSAPSVADPNQEIIDALSESERDAYYRALYGDAATSSGSASSAQATPAGCQAEAAEQTSNATVDPVIEQVQPLIEELYQRIDADTRVVEATAGYASCMAKAGYDSLRTPDAARQAVMDKIDAIVSAAPDPLAGFSPDELSKLTPEQQEELFSKRPEYDAKALAEAKSFELKVAKADFRCGQALDKVRLQVQSELEQRFIDDNGDLLARFKSAIGG